MAASVKTSAPSNNARPAADRKRPRGSADVIPFPVARRIHFINNAWRTTADMTDNEATQYFRSIIDEHRVHLERLGVSAGRVAADINELETMFGAAEAA